ncbi:hypothetical protein Glove_346g187 [Diversispora epigaea]|uniref:Uncharacterized protein n=1 Tax=Diversispora epigaea TaxID=1348612 RepID=A0A397HF06_9GLOM|nr:hypothetical protein Glove_346g187 [Diversispora epigaea]
MAAVNNHRLENFKEKLITALEEIDLPPNKANEREKFLEAIHTIFQVERINDKLFIKVSAIFVLSFYIHFTIIIIPKWDVLIVDTWLLAMNVRQPTRKQQIHPVINFFIVD